MGSDNVRFERRRYGNMTYTWAFVLFDGIWHDLGDPWPGVNWPKKELSAAIDGVIENQQAIGA